MEKDKLAKTTDEGYGGPPPPDEFDNTDRKPMAPVIIVTPAKVKCEQISQTSNDASVLIASVAKPTPKCHASVHITTATTSSTNQENPDVTVAKKQEVDKKSVVVSKIVYNNDNQINEKDLTLKLNSLVTYAKVDDDPKKQQVGYEVFYTDIIELELTEISEDDLEPRYEIFGADQPLCKDHAEIASEWKINNDCPSCYLDCCDEWRFGQYCVSAVERYWNENSHSATVREAYIHFVAHYNRVLDWHSYGDGFTHKLRKTQITKPPYCMIKGSLRHAIQWIKWQTENGSEKEWYAVLRKRKRIPQMEKESEEEIRKKEFKVRTLNTHRYGNRKSK